MRKLALALALVLTSLAGSAHAAVAPSNTSLRSYLKTAKLTPVAHSSAPNSLAQKFKKQWIQHGSHFQSVVLTPLGLDRGRIAYIPEIKIKGLSMNTAYIVQRSIAGTRLVAKVALPRF